MIALAALLLAAAPASHDKRCDSVVTPDLIACAQADYDRTDAALNAQWKASLAKVKQWEASGANDPASNGGLSYTQSLLTAQRAWLAYRDAECKFQIYGNAGGHELPIYRLSCLSALTRQRTIKLKADFAEGR
jgi:uncharacterized protein YecT (DUF1311 family)